MKKQIIKINESQLKQIIRESLSELIFEGNYIDAAYHGPYGNRSQYAPTENDVDAIYAYDDPGQLSMLAQTPFKAKGSEGAAGRWARSEKFRSIVPKSIEEFGIFIPYQYDTKEFTDALQQICGKYLKKEGDHAYLWELNIEGIDGETLFSKRCFRNEDDAERDATNTMRQIMKLNPNLTWRDFEDSGIEVVEIYKGNVETDRVLVFYEDTGWMD